ncbi:MAG: acetyltransferase [Bryobacteraceae bacterium]|jgi:hypothetical protein
MCAPAFGQAPVHGSGGNIRIVNTDMAVLEMQEARNDLPCSVTPRKPVLGFDLRFHAGYDVDVPLKELSGSENELTILFRVTPATHKDDPTYFVQHIHVPSLEEDARGYANLQGDIDMGEGNYHVDWLMRDRGEHVCSFYWDMEAALAQKDKQIELAIAPAQVEGVQFEQFKDEPPVERSQSAPPLSIKVLVNFAPQNYDAAALRPLDTVALVSILRRISREPQFGKFSVVAFNIQEQRVLYRQTSADKIDFPALGDAIHSVKLGTVDLKRLSQKHGDTEFLADLIKTEMSADHPDAVVFAGPKIMLDEAVPQDTLKPFATDINYPVFYMNYNLNPQVVPWKDSISRAVKIFKGTEYTITRPRDLWFAVTEMVSRIVKSKRTSSSSLVSTQ